MSRLSVSRRASGTARLAVVGAASPDGARLREALEAVKVPGGRVDLYATAGDEVVLSEYAGEARLIQEPRIEEIIDHDVIFLCERTELARQTVRESSGKGWIIDLVDAVPSDCDSRLVHMGVNPEAARGKERVLVVPHPLAIVLGELLRPVRDSFELAEVVAVVIRPASDFGEQGVHELREQTVSLLNFGRVPVETFGRQLAFNIVPGNRLSCDSKESADHVTHQVARLMDWPANRLTMQFLAASIFYGHALQLHLRFENGVTLAELRRVIEAGGSFEPPSADGPSTPVEVADEYTTRLADVSEDGLGGFWVWAVAGETRAKGAHQAVRLADALCDL